MQGQIVAGLIIWYAGSPEEGEEWVRPLREFGSEVNLVQPMSYTVVQNLLDPGNPPGRNNYWKVENLRELGGGAINTIVAHAARMLSPFTHVVIQPMGRAISCVREDETALGGRDAAYALHAISMWENLPESNAHIAWTREFLEAMEPFFTTPGISLNFTSDQNEDKVKAFFGPAKYERLVALKNQYDPKNLFRLNQNIKPTANDSVRG
jgi:hypothetical protein